MKLPLPCHNHLGGTKMNGIRLNCFVLVSVLVLSIGLNTAALGTSSLVSYTAPHIIGSTESANVTDVEYEWQQVNGLCHWSCLAMTFRAAGIPFGLPEVCAASGIGFTSLYISSGSERVFWDGPHFRQMVPQKQLAEFYGLNVTLIVDVNNSNHGATFAAAQQLAGVDFVVIDGWDQAFGILKSTIKDGYPVELLVNPYYLPHSDYDLLRSMGWIETGSGHSVVSTGFDEAIGVVYLADPGIGIIGESYGRPSQSEWNYAVNFTTLEAAWNRMYGMVVVQPTGEGVNHAERNIAEYILSRLQGDWDSHVPEKGPIPGVHFGSDAFRELALDMTSIRLSDYFESIGNMSPAEKSAYLYSFGVNLEQRLSLQYAAFQAALTHVSSVLPGFNLDAFVRSATDALLHFDALTSNASLNDFDYSGGGSDLTDCLEKIAYHCQFTTSGDIIAAAEPFEDELTAIQIHLVSIADAWDDMADALMSELDAGNAVSFVLLAGVSVVMILVLTFYVRRRN